MADHALIGRRDELDLARGLLRRALDGSPGVLLVGGEAGVGRSRLVAAVADEARGLGVHVAAGTCVRMDAGALTYAAVVDALRGLVATLDPAEVATTLGAYRHEVVRLLPEVSRAGGGASATAGAAATTVTVATGHEPADNPMARLRLFEALGGWLHRLAERGPLLLVVDDLQWADAATLDLVRSLAGGMSGRMAMVVALRTDEGLPPPVQATVAELIRDGAERVELEPFDRSELAALAAGVRGPGAAEPDDAALDGLLERTGGNPFLAIELCEAGLLEPGASERVIPRSLHDILDARIAALDPSVTEVLRAAAIHPGPIDDGVLAAVLDVAVRAVGTSLREARVAGVLTAGAGGPAFRHELQREVLLEQLGPGERRSLHGAYADALAGTRDPAAATAIAWHRDASGDDARALEAHVAALEAAMSAAAFEAAWRHAERAADLRSRPGAGGRDEPPGAAELLGRASNAALLAGDPTRSAAFARRALDALGPGGGKHRLTATLRDGLRWALWEAGDRAGAAAELDRGMDGLDDRTPPEMRALLTAQRAAMRMDDADPAVALGLADEAVRLATETGSRDAQALALGVRGRTLATHGEVDAGIASLRAAIAIADEVGSLQGRITGVAMIATILARWGRSREAIADIDASIAAADAAGLARSLGAQLVAQAARACFAIGRWDEALRRIGEGLARRPAQPIEAELRLVALRLAAARGQAVQAEALERRLGALAPALGDPDDVAGVRVARAEAALATGRPEAVRALLDEQLEALAEGQEPGPSAAWLAGLAAWAEADLALGARARADEAGASEAAFRLGLITRVVREQAGTRARWGPLVTAIVAHVEAEAARATDGADRVAAWSAAAVAWAAIDRPFYTGWARYRLAEARLAHGEPRPAIAEELGAAAEAARGLGASVLLGRVERLARLAKVDLRSGAAAPVGATGARGVETDPLATLGLTPREREILRLVAAGWSNARIAEHLVISVSTASVHVSNILAKLDVENRVEAAALAHRLGVVGDAPPDA